MLMFAAHAGHTDSVRLLLRYPLHLDLTDSQGESALQMAVNFENEACVQLLLEAGATNGGGANHPLVPAHAFESA